ncbi:C-GCAxxG-C-C family (seleno)protein [Saccharicrinis carchari]|uniref:C-GCAxxG-C-C family (seleno)protein n=1 Tax=Saccharicrinis carchari TaxID=1168039 RepID=UPI00163D7F14|nr:C-GCAxxG-C-C family (seleno)protein [Saccharicrinis carchari]
MKTKIAEQLFHGAEGYNCAQAILKTFQKEFEVDEQAIVAAARNGGGRAEGGLCGALYAAHQLLGDNPLQQKIDMDFIAKGSSVRCREIRTERRLSCKQCVSLAAQNLQGMLGT